MSKPKRKYRWLRRSLRISGVLLVLFIIACFVFDHYVQFRKSDKELNEIFAERKIDAKIMNYEVQRRILRYIISGNDTIPTLVMWHGSRVWISNYSGRLSNPAIKDKFRVYAVD